MRATRLVSLVVPLLVVPGLAAAQSRYFTYERGIDRPGHAYRFLKTHNAADCSLTCQAANSCRAWTYVKPGAPRRAGTASRCWLKHVHPGCGSVAPVTSTTEQHVDRLSFPQSPVGTVAVHRLQLFGNDAQRHGTVCRTHSRHSRYPGMSGEPPRADIRPRPAFMSTRKATGRSRSSPLATRTRRAATRS